MKTTDTPKTVVDEVIAEVRQHKEAIAAEHDYNVDSLLSDLQERQKSNPRLVSRILRGEQTERWAICERFPRKNGWTG